MAVKSLLSQLRWPRVGKSQLPGGTATDIVSRLPFELQALILAYLGPDDIVCALNACRTWRHFWLSDEICNTLADQWFPGLYNHIQMTANGQDQGELFRRALQKIRCRISGKFASAIQFGMSLEDDRVFKLSAPAPSSERVPDLKSEKPLSRIMMYVNGRIAWWPESWAMPFYAIVDDLRTRKRRAYVFSGHQNQTNGYKTAMSNKLFIIGRQTTLQAWHLELNCLKSVEVPESFERCVVEGETVLVVSKTAEIYLWQFGHAMEHVDMTSLGLYQLGPVTMGGLDWDFSSVSLTHPSYRIGLRFKQSGILVDFIIHPAAIDVFFVITFDQKKLVVHEITRGKSTGTWHLDDEVLSDSSMECHGYLRWEKIDSHGGYCLMSVWRTAGTETWHSDCPRTDRTRLASVCFNVYTKSFTVLCHPISTVRESPTRPEMTFSCQLWNGQLAIQDRGANSGSHRHSRLISSVADCARIQAKHQGIGNETQYSPYYSTSLAQGRSFALARRQQNFIPIRTGRVMLDFILDFETLYDHDQGQGLENIPSQLSGTQRLIGDDDFLVYVDCQICTVWSFGDKIPIKPVS